MKTNLYAAYDRVAGTYATPFAMDNDDLALRSFNNVLKESPFRSDISLYRVGVYNVETAQIDPKVEFICNYTGE